MLQTGSPSCTSAVSWKQGRPRTFFVSHATPTQRLSCQQIQSPTRMPGWRASSFRAMFRASSSDPRSEEHTSELQSLMRISYAVFCLKKKTTQQLLNDEN